MSEAPAPESVVETLIRLHEAALKEVTHAGSLAEYHLSEADRLAALKAERIESNGIPGESLLARIAKVDRRVEAALAIRSRAVTEARNLLDAAETLAGRKAGV